MSEDSANQASAGRDVFVSYASQDVAVANSVVENLERQAIKCWIAPRDVRPGTEYADAIVGAINESKAVVLILSGSAVASSHVGREIERAASKHKQIIAFRIDAAPLSRSLEYFLSNSQWIDVQALGMPEALVKLVEAVSRAPVVRPPNPTATKVGSGRAMKRAVVVAAVVVTVVVGALAFRLWSSKHGDSAPAAVAISDKSIAVLPFTDMSQKKDQEYFGDGMAEEILDLLAKIPGLTVIGRTSSFQFKGKNEDLRTIGSKLNAAYVLEGSVRNSGAHIRVTSQLIDTRSGAHIWSESFDRDFGDTLTLQNQIATSVARTLQIAVTSRESLSALQPGSMDAYTFYLRGRVAFDRGDVPAMAEAQQDFEQALSLDPSFGRAAEGVLLSYLNRIYAGAVPNNVGWPRLQQLAATALQLDPHSAFAHSALAWFHYSYDYDWSACNREIDTVIAARTHDPTALIYAAYVAGAIGRSADGTSLIREALTLDPLNPDVYQALGGILLYQRDYEGAERAFRRSLDISPQFAGSHLYIGGTRLFRGRPKEALSEIEAEPATAGRDALLTATFFALGRKRDSDASLQRLLNNKDGDAFWSAAAYALRNENDLAFEWLNKAYEQKDLSLSLGRSEYFASLRTDPRWKPFMRRMNIPE